MMDPVVRDLLGGIGRRLADEDDGQPKVYTVESEGHMLNPAVYGDHKLPDPPSGLLRISTGRRYWFVDPADFEEFEAAHPGFYFILAR